MSVKSEEIRGDRWQLQPPHHSQLVIQIQSFLTIARTFTHEIALPVVIAIGILLLSPIGSPIRTAFCLNPRAE